MASGDPRGDRSAGVSAVLATVFSTVGFFALAVFGLGALTVVTDRDLISVAGLGPLPGAAGMAVAVVAFSIGAGLMLRPTVPRSRTAVVVALAVVVAHLAALWFGVLLASGDLVLATAVAGEFVRGGAELVLLVAAGVAAVGGAALRRTPSQHRPWGWEDDRDEEG